MRKNGERLFCLALLKARLDWQKMLGFNVELKDLEYYFEGLRHDLSGKTSNDRKVIIEVQFSEFCIQDYHFEKMVETIKRNVDGIIVICIASFFKKEAIEDLEKFIKISGKDIEMYFIELDFRIYEKAIEICNERTGIFFMKDVEAFGQIDRFLNLSHVIHSNKKRVKVNQAISSSSCKSKQKETLEKVLQDLKVKCDLPSLCNSKLLEKPNFSVGFGITDANFRIGIFKGKYLGVALILQGKAKNYFAALLDSKIADEYLLGFPIRVCSCEKMEYSEPLIYNEKVIGEFSDKTAKFIKVYSNRIFNLSR